MGWLEWFFLERLFIFVVRALAHVTRRLGAVSEDTGAPYPQNWRRLDGAVPFASEGTTGQRPKKGRCLLSQTPANLLTRTNKSS